MIKEDAPVTTTDNAGVGLESPKLPLKLFKRYKKLTDLVKNVSPKNQLD